MNTNSTDREMNESNAGAGMNSNKQDVERGVRRNAGHPGDASHAAGMRRPADDAAAAGNPQPGDAPGEGPEYDG